MERPHGVAAVTALIFDFDGTLFRLATDYPGLRAALAPGFQVEGLDCNASSVSECLGLASPSLKTEALAVIGRFESEGIRLGELIPGVRELWGSLKTRGIRLGILTRNCRATVQQAFAACGLTAADALVGIDDDVPPKPAPEAMSLVLARLGVASAGCVIVGDTWHDMAAGEQFGMFRVLRVNPDLDHAPVERADLVVSSFEGLDVDRFIATITGAHVHQPPR